MNLQFLDNPVSFDRYCKEISLHVTQMSPEQYKKFSTFIGVAITYAGNNEKIDEKYKLLVGQNEQAISLSENEWEIFVDKDELACDNTPIEPDNGD